MSSFTYNENIPLSTNNPSADQPRMQTNTNSIKSIIAEDHYTFGTTNPATSDGQHKWVRFPANNALAAGATTHGLFTADVSTVPQLFWYSGVAANSSSQYVNVAASGSTFLFGGMILKWGNSTAAGAGSNIAFASAFPNACYQVLITGITSSATYFYVDTVTTTNFTVKHDGGAVVNRTFRYLAIGS